MGFQRAAHAIRQLAERKESVEMQAARLAIELGMLVSCPVALLTYVLRRVGRGRSDLHWSEPLRYGE